MMMDKTKCLALVSPRSSLLGEAYISESDFLFILINGVIDYLYMYRSKYYEPNLTSKYFLPL